MEANLTPAVASAIQNSKIQSEIATSVAKKTLDTQKQQGEAAVALIQQAQQLSSQIANGSVDVKL